MSKPSDFLGASPKTALNKPFMHVQDQRPNGTQGGSSVVGVNLRQLNTVLTNGVLGASLSADKVTLPAGKYYIECKSCGYGYSTQNFIAQIRKTDGTVLLQGAGATSGGKNDISSCDGEFTLLTSTSIEVVTVHNTAVATDGLGTTVSLGEYEIYADLKIWQLDAVVKTPILVNDKLYPLPANSMVTGNMHGLEYAKTGDNEITVQAGICMDSLNQTVLSLSAPQVVSIGTTINQIYNLFLCDDGVVRIDTDVDGAGLGAYKVRWIGFVLNNSSGVLFSFKMNGNCIAYENMTARPVIVSALTYAFVEYSLTSVMPWTRIETLCFGSNTSTQYALSYDGITEVMRCSISNYDISAAHPVTQSSLWFRYWQNIGTVEIATMTLKR